MKLKGCIYNFTEAKIQVYIESPQILLPGPNTSKPDYIVADLSDFSMHNMAASSETAIEDSLTFICTLSKMHIRSVHGEVETDILHDVRLDVIVVSGKGFTRVCKQALVISYLTFFLFFFSLSFSACR